MNDYQISVVIPVYNSKTTITRAIRSVQIQSYRPIEIIIIDDASTDDTVDTINQIHSKIPLILIKNEKNSGPSISRNRGIMASQGNWIAFLDADDFWHEKKLEIQMGILQKTGLKMIGGIPRFFSGSFDFKFQKIQEIKVIPSKMLFRNQFQASSLLIYRTKELEFHPGMTHAEDYEFASRMVRQLGEAIRIEPALTYLGKKPYAGNGLSSDLWEMEKGEIKVIAEERNFFLRIPAIIFSFTKFLRRVLIKLLRTQES